MAQSSTTFLADFSQDREKNAGRADALFCVLAVVWCLKGYNSCNVITFRLLLNSIKWFAICSKITATASG